MPSRSFTILVFALALAACGVKSDLVPPGGVMAATAADENPVTPVTTRADPSKPLHPLGQRERNESATAAATSTALPPIGP
jgi:predicted small lipoprotein YifL